MRHFSWWLCKLLVVGMLSGCSLPVLGQDWKATYDQAIELYQRQSYSEALDAAQKAYSLSETLDSRNQVYTIQLITAICVENGNTEIGLQWIEKETALYEKVEGPTSATLAESLRKHALLLQQANKLNEADQKALSALAVYRQRGEEKTLPYATLLAFHGQLLAATGKLNEASTVLTEAAQLLSVHAEGAEDFIASLSLSAQIDKRLNDLPAAEQKFRRLTDLLEKNQLTSLPEYADAKSSLAEIALARGQSSESERLLQTENIQADKKAQQFLKIAIDYQNNHLASKAIENYEFAKASAKEAQLQNNTAFSIFLNYGRLLVEMGQLEAGAAELKVASQLADKLYPAASAEHAFLSFAQGDLLIHQHQVKEALAAYQKGLLHSASLPLESRVRFVDRASRSLLAENHSDAALLLLQPVVTALDPSSIDKSSVELRITYGEALLEANQVDQAVSFLSKCVVSTADINTKNRYEVELAQALEERGEWRKALQMLQAVDLTSTISETIRAENSYRMAHIYQRLGDYANAEKKFRSAIDSYKKLDPPQPDDLLRVYNSLAIFYTQLGNYGEAERLYTQLIRETDTFSGFHTTLLQNLAGVYLESLRFQDAQKLLESVVEQDKQRLGGQHPDYAISLQNLAAVYQKTNQGDRAIQLYRQALNIDRQNGNDRSLAYATKAANLGVALEELGQLNEAEELIKTALRIREEKLGREHPDYVFNEYNLAVIEQQKGAFDQADALFTHVSSFYRNQIRELFPAMSEKEKTAFFNKISEVINAYQSFATENYQRFPHLLGDLYDFRLATKALLLNASTKIRNRILSSGDAALLQKFAQWLQTKEELGKLYMLTTEQRESNKSNLIALQQKANELEKQLSAQSELFARETTDTNDWKKLKSQLGAGDAAIEMIRLRLTTKKDSIIYAALVVRNQSVSPELILFPNGSEMEGREFSFYRNSIRLQMQNERSYDVYWKPLERALTGSSTLYFSADGVYNKLSILTFLNPSTHQYLLDQYTIKLVSNTKELLTPPRMAGALQTAALFGHPDYRLDATPGSHQSETSGKHSTRSYFSKGIPDLPGTQLEISRISEILTTNKWAANQFVGKEASEEAIKQQQNTGVLHIATHGFFIESTADDSEVMSSTDLGMAEYNPLTRSGLVLSGAEKYLNLPQPINPSSDGILTAYEAIQLNLDRTDLVVLSACETGAGEVRNGEGVYGLQRAFLLAGANSLLMSLWKVDDEATQDLMTEFYRQWAKTKNKAIAFRETQMEIRKKYNLPYFWGSFVMIGAN